MVFEKCVWTDGRRTDDGWTPDHGHPISSPCEPNGSGDRELKKKNSQEISAYCVCSRKKMVT